jgi:tRNA pseudouridine-54 N-methylase
MKDDSFHLPGKNGGLSISGHLMSCHKCGRNVMVELVLIGVPHHIQVIVTCGECVEPSKQIRKEYPEIVTKVENWLRSGSENEVGRKS